MKLLLPAPGVKTRKTSAGPRICALVFTLLFCIAAWSIFSFYYSVVEGMPVPNPVSTAINRIESFKAGSKFFSGTLKDPTSLYSRTIGLASEDSSFKEGDENATASSAPKVPNTYAYSVLSEEDKTRYEIILDALQNCKKRAYPDADKESIKRIRACVEADYPLLEDFVAMVMVEGDMLSPAYVAGVSLVSDEDRNKTMDAMESVRDKWKAGILPQFDDYQKALYAYRWIIDNCEYDNVAAGSNKDIVINAKGRDSYKLAVGSNLPSELGQTVSNVLVDKKAVCAGYAKTFQYLMQSVGIPCTYISGTAEGENHAWNLVYLDGEYYYVDATWGELDYAEGGSSAYPEGAMRYWYFGVDSPTMEQTHKAASFFPLPECASIADNYYVREGLYLDIPSPQFVGSLMAKELPKNSLVTIRCANKEVYDALYNSWVVTGAIGRFSNQEGYRYFGVEKGLNIIEILPY